MAKFNTKDARVHLNSPVQATDKDSVTFEGADAWSREEKSDLYLLGVTNKVSEKTFYEGPSERDSRFRNLVHGVTKDDPDWMQRFIPWLRNTANMRSAAIVALAEYVKAGGPNGRQLIVNTLARADEPGELLAYWSAAYGRNFPQPLKRGVADATLKLYNEYSLMKYDSKSRGWRFADVIQLTHPKAKADWQNALFKHALDRRYGGEGSVELLSKIATRQMFEAVAPKDRRGIMKAGGVSQTLQDAGATWEWFSGWITGGMDGEAWDAVIPSMGYMALLRNLRNFDEAGINTQSVDYVKAVLADPDRVAKSRQFPYRFLTAYKNVGNVRWAEPLEKAMQLATLNVPEFPGRTLVITDTSGSMSGYGWGMSGRGGSQSSVMPYEIAGLMAATVAQKAEKLDFISFASDAGIIPVRKGDSILTVAKRIKIGQYGHGTDLNQGLKYYDGHDRVIVFSDMQVAQNIRKDFGVPMYLFNVGGYSKTPFEVGKNSTFEIGGFSDASFGIIHNLEQLRSADWPF